MEWPCVIPVNGIRYRCLEVEICVQKQTIKWKSKSQIPNFFNYVLKCAQFSNMPILGPSLKFYQNIWNFCKVRFRRLSICLFSLFENHLSFRIFVLLSATSNYPPIDNCFGGSHHVTPETLLLHMIILTSKWGLLELLKKKYLALACVIMLAIWPKSYLSHIKIWVAIYVYKKFGSEHLLNLLVTLRFSATCDEASMLEDSYVLQAKRAIVEESANPCSQFIFNNADLSVNLLDGTGTFHVLGGMAATPLDAVTSETDVICTKVTPASDL